MKYQILFYLFFIFSNLFCQEIIGEWGAFTSPLKIRDVLHNDKIYAATEGGLLQIDENGYIVLTTINGLEGVDLSCITVDHESNLWLGGSSPMGFLQVFDPYTQTTVYNFDFGLTKINDIVILDSLAFVSFDEGQDFGIMKFLYNEK